MRRLRTNQLFALSLVALIAAAASSAYDQTGPTAGPAR